VPELSEPVDPVAIPKDYSKTLRIRELPDRGKDRKAILELSGAISRNLH